MDSFFFIRENMKSWCGFKNIMKFMKLENKTFFFTCTTIVFVYLLFISLSSIWIGLEMHYKMFNLPYTVKKKVVKLHVWILSGEYGQR